MDVCMVWVCVYKSWTTPNIEKRSISNEEIWLAIKILHHPLNKPVVKSEKRIPHHSPSPNFVTMAHSRALNYEKNYLVRDKEWKVVLHDWVPQSLESQTKHFQFPLFKPTASQGLYVPSPLGHRRGGWCTVVNMIYNEGLKHKKTEETKPRQPLSAKTSDYRTTTYQLVPLSSSTRKKRVVKRKSVSKKSQKASPKTKRRQRKNKCWKVL